MSDTVYALILGTVQGLTEFLPVSSSAHLIIVSWLIDGKSLPLALNVALHIGTLTAVLIYFRKDWFQISRNGLRFLGDPKNRLKDQQLLIGLVLGSIPAGVIGLLWKDEIETYLHRPVFTIVPLIVIGILLVWVDRRYPSTRNLSQLNVKDAFIIGIFQALALIPGTSRSGITMIGGRWLQFDKETAARFSFLLGTPAMLGAALLSADEIWVSVGDPIFYYGFVTAVIVGFLAIEFLLRIIRRFGFLGFAIYRCFLAAFLTLIMF
jgi:undecaprenyl-diphosphatase